MVTDKNALQRTMGWTEEKIAQHNKSRDLFDSIYNQDTPIQGISWAWIQWKGTSVCCDIHCQCGAMNHMDAEFFYFYECINCHKRFAVGKIVKLIPLTEEQIKDYVKDESKFQKEEE